MPADEMHTALPELPVGRARHPGLTLSRGIGRAFPWLVALSMALVSLPAPAAAPGSESIVTLRDGSLRGARDGGIESFKGIPYAAPPVGDLRWMPPQPVSRWDRTRDATQFGNECMQAPLMGGGMSMRVSEDCLFLNVWRPANARKAAVMVWIYGGAFASGATSTPLYNGASFARDGVIFVSVNYRVGRLGFFGFPALTAANPGGPLGNYGIMDQIAALKWVKHNIGAFGGDPDNVTIFGESSGGYSVNVLLASPLATGLFDKAIVQSGGGRDTAGGRLVSRDLPGLPSADTIGGNFAKANGIVGSGPEALAALRRLPAEKFPPTMADLIPGGGGSAPTYTADTIDGKVIVSTLAESFRSGRFARVPLIIGANSADLAFPFSKTMDEVIAPFGAAKDRALRVYDPKGANNVLLVNWWTDMDRMNLEPARFVSREFAKRGVPVYHYRFSHVSLSGAKAAEESPLYGPAIKTNPALREFLTTNAMHGTELAYLFDALAVQPGAPASANDQATARAMHSYWVNFAKTGNPNRPDARNPTWPRYDARGDRILDFAQDGPKVVPDPLRARLDLTELRHR